MGASFFPAESLTLDHFSPFAKAIYEQKYAHTKSDGTKETWEEIAARVAVHVLAAIPPLEPTAKYDTYALIRDRKFLPGGRYLYAAGRPLHQTQNCLLLRAEDSREGWSDLMHKATMALMTGAGIGVDYSDVRAEGSVISRTGGLSTGPLALMQMVNEAGRHIMQGGNLGRSSLVAPRCNEVRRAQKLVARSTRT